MLEGISYLAGLTLKYLFALITISTLTVEKPSSLIPSLTAKSSQCNLSIARFRQRFSHKAIYAGISATVYKQAVKTVYSLQGDATSIFGGSFIILGLTDFYYINRCIAFGCFQIAFQSRVVFFSFVFQMRQHLLILSCDLLSYPFFLDFQIINDN